MFNYATKYWMSECAMIMLTKRVNQKKKGKEKEKSLHCGQLWHTYARNKWMISAESLADRISLTKTFLFGLFSVFFLDFFLIRCKWEMFNVIFLQIFQIFASTNWKQKWIEKNGNNFRVFFVFTKKLIARIYRINSLIKCCYSSLFVFVLFCLLRSWKCMSNECAANFAIIHIVFRCSIQ